MKNYSAIILVTAHSSCIEKFKPLMKIDGKTPLQRCIELFKNSGISDIIVVTSYLDDRINKELNDIKVILKDIKIVINNKYSEGMYLSIIAGVESLSKETDAFFILPVDIPSVRECTIKKMMKSYEKIKNCILYPKFAKVKGYPTLVPYCLSQEIITSNFKGGLMDLFNKYKKQWHYEQVADRGILLNMDTKENLQLLLEHILVYSCPDYEECMEMLRLCKVSKDLVNHMKGVSELAKKITMLLNEKGLNLNINYVYAGALLHDLAKGNKNHAELGAKIVEGFGYKCLNEIIHEHMQLKTKNGIGEKEIVYLCDKCIKGSKLVTLREKFAGAFSKYKDMPNILENVNNKYTDAKMLKKNIEEILGISLKTISQKF